jgi:hypothetical protein
MGVNTVRVVLAVEVDSAEALRRALQGALDTMQRGHANHGIEDDPGAVAVIARLQALLDAVDAAEKRPEHVARLGTCTHPADVACVRCCAWPKCPDCDWSHDHLDACL